jgi:hypothetical protein
MSWLASYSLICNELVALTEAIEPIDAHAAVFSHKLYQLLLRSCTEFESICRTALLSVGYPLPKRPSIQDYKALSCLAVERYEIGVHFWRPGPLYVRPFKDWSHAKPPLQWYADYNLVKHDRHANFERASLENVCLATGGLCAIMADLFILPTNERGMVVKRTDAHTESSFPSFPVFSIRCAR